MVIVLPYGLLLDITLDTGKNGLLLRFDKVIHLVGLYLRVAYV